MASDDLTGTTKDEDAPKTAPRCEGCGKAKPDVKRAPDPYMQDIFDTKTWVWLCLECYQQRVDDI